MQFTRSLLLICGFLIPLSLLAQPQSLSLDQFASGFSNPVDITHAGDERIFVVEKVGRIWILDQNGNPNGTAFLDISNRVNSGGERGLLGLAFHPDYANNGYFYVYYIDSNNGTQISRFSVSSGNPDLADSNSEVFVLSFGQPFSNHNGGDLDFDLDGNLLISSGDGGSGGDPQNNGQNKSSLLGKILRIDVNGTPYAIPPGNPYYNFSAITRDEIMATGLRNPWRMDVDPVSGNLWIGDVGQDDFEEIDYLEIDPRREENNFGWRCYEANAPFNVANCGPASAYTAPVYAYVNNSSNGCSITGGAIYRGARYQNLWGHYFFGDYCTGNLWYTPFDDNNQSFGQTVLLNTYNYNFSCFGEDFYGQIYALDHDSGVIYRFADTTCTPQAHIQGASTQYACDSTFELAAYAHPGLNYQWYFNGNPISGATDSIYTATQAGQYSVEVSNGPCSDVSTPVQLNLGALKPTIYGLASSYDTADPSVFLTGLPPGGTFSGPGISSTNLFDPSSAGPGTHLITYTYDDGQGCMGTDTLDTFIGTVGISEGTPTQKLRVYPVPASNQLWLEFLLANGANIQVELLDPVGRRVWSQSEYRLPGENRFSISVAGFPAGLYVLRLGIGDEFLQQKVLID